MTDAFFFFFFQFADSLRAIRVLSVLKYIDFTSCAMTHGLLSSTLFQFWYKSTRVGR